MDGLLENPVKFSSLQRKCICCNSEQREHTNRILLQAINTFYELHTQKGVEPLPQDEILDYIKSNLLILFIDDKYVVGLEVGYTWFSSEKYLMEEFVYKYGEGPATMKDVGDGITTVGQLLGCTKVRVGTLAADNETRHRALAKVYQRAGFKFDAITLTRDI